MNFLPPELIISIAYLFDKVSDVSKFRRTCKEFYFLMILTWRPKDNSRLIAWKLLGVDTSLSMCSLTTWDLVNKYPEYNWDFEILSCHPNITTEIIINNSQCEWDYHSHVVTKHCNIDLLLTSCPELLSDDSFIAVLSLAHNLTLSIAKKYNLLKWIREDLCISGLTISELEELGCLSNDYKLLSRNKQLTMQDILSKVDHIDPEYRSGRACPKQYWDFYEIGKYSSIKWEDVINNPKFLWNYRLLSHNPNITWDIVRNNKDKDWDWIVISHRLSVNWSIIHELLPENWYKLNSRRIMHFFIYANLSIDFIKSHPEIPWNAAIISNINLDMEELIKLGYGLCSRHITCSNFKWSYIVDYPQFDWKTEDN